MNQQKEFKVKFYGVRGSHPNPSKNNFKYGGNTSCVEVKVNGHKIIIDAGTGIINLGNEIMKEYIASGNNSIERKPINLTMLFSHTHHDHIQGFPFFKPAFLGTATLYLFGAKSLNVDFAETLSQSMFTPFFPVDLGEMAAQMFIKNIKETEMILLYPDKPIPEEKNIYKTDNNVPKDVVKITCIKSYAHPKDGVLIFKIEWNEKSVVYASDKESYINGDARLINFAKNADILIHDTQYIEEDYNSSINPKQGYGHSTPAMAIETAKKANVKKLVMFHYDPSYTDDVIDNLELTAKKNYNNIVASYEDMEIDLFAI